MTEQEQAILFRIELINRYLFMHYNGRVVLYFSDFICQANREYWAEELTRMGLEHTVKSIVLAYKDEMEFPQDFEDFMARWDRKVHNEICTVKPENI